LMVLRIEFGSYIGDNKFVYHFRTRSQKHRRLPPMECPIISTFVKLWPLQYSRISWAINHNWTPQNDSYDCEDLTWTNPSVANCAKCFPIIWHSQKSVQN
jgi:hypothetical protein